MPMLAQIDPYIALQLKNRGFYEPFDLIPYPIPLLESFLVSKIHFFPDQDFKIFPFYEFTFVLNHNLAEHSAKVYLNLITYDQVAKIYQAPPEAPGEILIESIHSHSPKYDLNNEIRFKPEVPNASSISWEEVLYHYNGLNALAIFNRNCDEKAKWIMPAQKDEYFSAHLHNRIFAAAKSFGIDSLLVSIREQYTHEPFPGHYQSAAQYGNPDDSIHHLFLGVDYSAKLNDHIDVGTMEIDIVSDGSRKAADALLSLSFGLYDESIRQYYPEYTTTYNFRIHI